MMVSPSQKEAKKLSDRNHHLSFWKDAYSDTKIDLAYKAIAAENLLKQIDDIARKMKAIDENRRENAVRMGVSIHESDQVYSFDEEIKAVPALIKELKETYKKLGIDLENIA